VQSAPRPQHPAQEGFGVWTARWEEQNKDRAALALVEHEIQLLPQGPEENIVAAAQPLEGLGPGLVSDEGIAQGPYQPLAGQLGASELVQLLDGALLQKCVERQLLQQRSQLQGMKLVQ